jgi:phytoene synthase
MLNVRPGEGWNALIKFESQRARQLFKTGYEVLRYIPRRPAACVQTMAGIYERLLRKIERDPQLPLRERAALSRGEKLQVVLKSWLRPV